MRKLSNKGQMEISFGMIFSVFLIVAFIALTGYVIVKFLNFQETVKVGQFKEQFQKDVDSIWKSQQGKKELSYILPSKIKKVCFINLASRPFGVDKEIYSDLELVTSDESNLIFYPVGSAGVNSLLIEHVDLEKMIAENNPYCANVNEGKLTLKLNMDYGENLVTITK